MARLLGLTPHDRILDIGGGHDPFVLADVVVDIDFSSGHHRDGLRIPLDRGRHHYIQADVARLPFPDNYFDFVICIHVLEHVDDPGRACDELMRVACRGFIETPRAWTELYAGYPTHKWLIDLCNGTLGFAPVRYDASPFMNVVLPALWGSSELGEQTRKFRHIPCVQFQWEGEFQYILDRNAVDFVTSRSDADMAKRHHAYARNLLYWLASPAHGTYHAKRAVELTPGNKKYCELYAFYLALSGRWGDALAHGLDFKLGISAITGFCIMKAVRLALLCFRKITAFFPGL